MGRPRKPAIEKRGLSIKVLNFKTKHYDRKDLLNIHLTVDKKKYELSFLMDNYDHIFFPEFKIIDRYDSKSFNVISEFLKTTHSKIKYFIDNEMSRFNSENKTNSWDDCKEWWQEELENNNIEDNVNFWIKKNNDYLSQFDFSPLNEEGRLDELVSYLNKRATYVKPEFNSSLQYTDLMHLNKMLDNAIKMEDYEKAIEIREQIKQIK